MRTMLYNIKYDIWDEDTENTEPLSYDQATCKKCGYIKYERYLAT